MGYPVHERRKNSLVTIQVHLAVDFLVRVIEIPRGLLHVLHAVFPMRAPCVLEGILHTRGHDTVVRGDHHIQVINAFHITRVMFRMINSFLADMFPLKTFLPYG